MAHPVTASHPSNFSNLKCSPTTLICKEKTIILGDVTIGTDCVIHPTVTIIAKNGPIVIGNNNLIEERVVITNNHNTPMTIGDNNVFEVDSTSEARRVGSNNIMECKSRIGPSVELNDNCVIGAGCVLKSQEDVTDALQLDILPSSTVVSCQDFSRRVMPNLAASSQNSQLDFLRKILPNYQKLWRPANIGTPVHHR